MIGFIRGILAEKGNGYIVVDVGGVGYEIFVPANSGAYMSSEGQEVMIHTMMIVREDDMSLYGFTRKGEKDAFKKLITVSGVGAKAAISILSAFTLEQLQQQDPEYFYAMAPYALALGVEKAFAKQFSKTKLLPCPYISTGSDSQRSAKEWGSLISRTLDAMQWREKQLPLERLQKLIALLRK